MKTTTKPIDILIVEDNPGDFHLEKYYLKLSKLSIGKVIHVETLEKAIETNKSNQFDIVLLDLTLPDSTGLETVNSIVTIMPKLPVIVLSGNASEEVAKQSIIMGTQDYLMKGEFDERVLEKTISYSIERKKILQNLKSVNERYEIVNKVTRDIIWEWNMLNNEIIRNESFSVVLGYPNVPEKMGFNWFLNKVHPSDRENLKLVIEECLESHNDKWFNEYRVMASDGSYRYVMDRAHIQFDEEGKPVCMIGSIADLTEKKELEQMLHDQRLKLQKQLLEVNIQAHEEEKIELGKELHDNINQMLAAIKINISLIRSNPARNNDELLAQSYKYLEETIREVRNLSHSLVSPTLVDLSLVEAIEDIAAECNNQGFYKVKLYIDPNYVKFHIDKKMELMLYRILQEQVSNINKYSRASLVQVRLYIKDESLILYIEDDGVGFDPLLKSKGIGLRNIQSRVDFFSGQLEILSAPGKGCKITVSLPIKRVENQ